MAHDTTHAAFGTGRVTAQRRRISAAAAAMPGAFTVEALTEAVRRSTLHAQDASAATATVYRAVAAMEATGFLARIGSRDGSALYAHCTTPAHHHHVVCDDCGRIASTPCPLEVLDTTPAASQGFVITRHEVTLYGLCATCAEQRSGS